MQSSKKYLQRLTFKVWANPIENSKDRNTAPHDFSFIYGIGTDGLCDFEIAIDGLGLHEVFRLEMDQTRLKSYFGRLYHYLKTSVPMPAVEGVVTLKMELLSTSSPEPKEIVAAIAELQSHGGCGSDCGCGCH
jgi:hypothetical protein